MDPKGRALDHLCLLKDRLQSGTMWPSVRPFILYYFSIERLCVLGNPTDEGERTSLTIRYVRYQKFELAPSLSSLLSVQNRGSPSIPGTCNFINGVFWTMYVTVKC